MVTSQAQGVLDDLIDDREIEEDSDGSVGSKKRKKSDEDDDLDDRLEDDDYDLIEENLGVKVQRRKRFKRVRQQIDDDEESDGGEKDDNGDLQRAKIAERIFDDEDVSLHGFKSARDWNIANDWRLGLLFRNSCVFVSYLFQLHFSLAHIHKHTFHRLKNAL